ncbi:MAG: hypothetical protein JRE23_15740, partial [Deltaproteobacteria bacterium]|nr:hypothetical protein [Deltaproteobacteria bacterium]
MSGKYVTGTDKLMRGQIDLVTDNLLVYLCDSAEYSYNLATDESLSQLPESSIIAESTLDGKAIIGTALQANSTVFTNPTADRNADLLVICLAGTTFGNSWLIAAIDFDPLTTTGEDCVVEWENSLILG